MPANRIVTLTLHDNGDLEVSGDVSYVWPNAKHSIIVLSGGTTIETRSSSLCVVSIGTEGLNANPKRVTLANRMDLEGHIDWLYCVPWWKHEEISKWQRLVCDHETAIRDTHVAIEDSEKQLSYQRASLAMLRNVIDHHIDRISNCEQRLHRLYEKLGNAQGELSTHQSQIVHIHIP